MADSQFTTDDRHTVAHLDAQLRAGNQVDTRTIDPGDICPEVIPYLELCQCLTVQFGLRDQNTAGDQLRLISLPGHLYLTTEKDHDRLDIDRVGDHQNTVVQT